MSPLDLDSGEVILESALLLMQVKYQSKLQPGSPKLIEFSIFGIKTIKVFAE